LWTVALVVPLLPRIVLVLAKQEERTAIVVACNIQIRAYGGFGIVKEVGSRVIGDLFCKGRIVTFLFVWRLRLLSYKQWSLYILTCDCGVNNFFCRLALDSLFI
jgi:hypothetical protein